MPKPKLQVVGRDPEAPRGNPELIALLEQLLFDAKSGDLESLSAVLETQAGTELASAHGWDDFQAAGLHAWATNKYLSRADGDDED